MSDCGCTSSGSCSPCNQVNSQESVASWLSNLTSLLFGAITKTVSNGKATWSTPCSPTEVAGVPRGASEGYICYLIRLFAALGWEYVGIWNVVDTYTPNQIVTYNSYYLYRAKTTNTNSNPSLNPADWDLILTGQPGPPGVGGTPTFPSQVIVASPYLATDSDGVLLVEPIANTIINLDQIATLSVGKWYTIRTNSSTYTVTITPFAGDTINGAASYVLNLSGQSVQLQSVNGSTDWRIV